MKDNPDNNCADPTDHGISLALTERQKDSLQALNKPVVQPDCDEGDHKEEHTVKIEGRVKDGQLIVDNMSVEFMHRWMDCMDR